MVIYYILIHEQDMAKLFWEYSRTPVFLAIVCSNIHKWVRLYLRENITWVKLVITKTFYYSTKP